MMRAWFVLFALGLLIVALFWHLCGTDPVRPPEELGRNRPGPVQAHHQEDIGSDRARHEAASAPVPALPDDIPRVILDHGPRLPQEPHHTYWSRTQLVKHWDQCNSAVNLSEAQEQAILLSLYDAQQEVSGIMYGTGPRLQRDELFVAVDEIYAYRDARIQAILTPAQRAAWDRTESCGVMPLFASHGALRLPGDPPQKLYPPRYRSPDGVEDAP